MIDRLPSSLAAAVIAFLGSADPEAAGRMALVSRGWRDAVSGEAETARGAVEHACGLRVGVLTRAGVDVRSAEAVWRVYCRAMAYRRCPHDVQPRTVRVPSDDGQRPWAVRLDAGFAATLWVDGRVAASEWRDSDGSLLRFFRAVHALGDGEAAARVAALSTTLNEGVLDPDLCPLEEQVSALFELLAPGAYRVRVQHNVVHTFVSRFKQGNVVSWHPWGGHRPGAFTSRLYNGEWLHETQPRCALRAKRVEHYRAEIRAGRRPLLLLLSPGRHEAVQMRHIDEAHLPDTKPAYILDGHHKLEAYEAEGMWPSVLRVQSFVGGSEASSREAMALIDPERWTNSHGWAFSSVDLEAELAAEEAAEAANGGAPEVTERTVREFEERRREIRRQRDIEDGCPSSGDEEEQIIEA